MGSSVSVHKHPESSSKLRLSFGSKTDKILIPSSPAETLNGDGEAIKPATRPASRFGSKDEAFFDSQPWLDSDCEDDFLSVNGDFTPSHGSTPVHENFSTKNQQVNEEALPITEGTISSVPEPSPTSDKKKRLSELFKESLRINEPLIEDPAVVETESSPYVSQVSSERTPNRELMNERKPVKSSECCLPMLLSCRSFSGRKKRASTPAHIIV